MPDTELKQFISDKFPFLDTDFLYSRINWSIRLRWLAISGFFSFSYYYRITYDPPLPFNYIWMLLVVLTLINLIYFLHLRLAKELSFINELTILHIHVIIDLLALSLLIHFTGGIETPIYFFYIFHIVFSSILFRPRTAFIYTTAIFIVFSGMVLFEYAGLLPHYVLFDISIYQNSAAPLLILVVFFISMFTTTYICISFMEVYRQSKRIIAKQNKELLELNRQRSQFFRFTSHELKSPLIAVKTSVDVVLKTYRKHLPDKARDMLQRASARTAQMLTMIKELLELSKSNGKIPQEEKQSLNLAEVIQEVVEQEAEVARAKNIRLKFEPSVQKANVNGRIRDFRTIFQNLISNAIRYTPDQGKVHIKTQKGNGKFVFEISDTGIGIAPEDLEHIFDEFYRSKAAKQMVHFGTGLGLSLVRKIIENYGGKISVESEINKGTRFIVEIPCT